MNEVWAIVTFVVLVLLLVSNRQGAMDKVLTDQPRGSKR